MKRGSPGPPSHERRGGGRACWAEGGGDFRENPCHAPDRDGWEWAGEISAVECVVGRRRGDHVRSEAHEQKGRTPAVPPPSPRPLYRRALDVGCADDATLVFAFRDNKQPCGTDRPLYGRRSTLPLSEIEATLHGCTGFRTRRTVSRVCSWGDAMANGTCFSSCLRRARDGAAVAACCERHKASVAGVVLLVGREARGQV